MALLLTYIVPAYNCQDFITDCLKGIYSLPLTEEELEVIVVDDCSTDNTLGVLEKYASGHSNMKVLHQERNQRQGAARNRAIDMARGEYIAFSDADDAVVVEGVMNALAAVSQTSADICYFDFEYEQPRGKWNLFAMPEGARNVVMSSQEYLEEYYTCWYNAPWRNLYRRQWLQALGERFVEGLRWEDCDWTVRVYSKAAQVQFVEGVGYRYAFNENSTCAQTPTPQALSEQLMAGLRLLAFADEVRPRLPRLAATLSDEARTRYVGVLRLRNLSKYSKASVSHIYTSLGSEKRKQLAQYHFTRWIDFVLNHKNIVLSLWALAYPITRLGRQLTSKGRKI